MLPASVWRPVRGREQQRSTPSRTKDKVEGSHDGNVCIPEISGGNCTP
jgi:hypothetical protein